MKSHEPESTPSTHSPVLDQLRQTGWFVGAVVGRYCVAWRGPEEIVLRWDAGHWRQVNNRSAARAAA